MATYVKFQPWVEYLVEGANVGSDQFTVFLTNSAPSAANSVIADITEISYTNLSSRNITTSSSSQSGGTHSLVFADLTLTASGAVGPFRYVGIMDNTLASDPLVAYYDHGSNVTMASAETFLVDFGANFFAVV